MSLTAKIDGIETRLSARLDSVESKLDRIINHSENGA